MANSFISLHNRSAYSFGSALAMPKQLVEFAAIQGMAAIALTDLDGLYAAVEFQQACHAAGIKPIFGVELRVAVGSSMRAAARAEARGSSEAEISVTLLARDLAGYGNLCRLISLHQLRDDCPRAHPKTLWHRRLGGADTGETPVPQALRGRTLSLADLGEHAAGLICLLNGGNGECGIENGERSRQSSVSPRRGDPLSQFSIPNSQFAPLRDVFANRLYIELAIHQPSDAPLARRRARLADELGLPVVATCESRCLRREDGPVLKALASIGTLTLLDQPHPDKPVGDWHLRTPAEMARLFARRPDALANTLAIAEQCNVALDLSRNRFPAFASPDGRGAIEHLRDLAVAGCRRRYVDEPPLRGIGGPRPTLDEALARLNRELSIIEQVHYAEYFLVFHEIAEHCRREGISFLARGSAADSLVCYALGVSHACPFRFDLPFDRFINPERAKFSKMADIDLDLPWDQRDQVIRWVYDRWGHDRVAMIGAPNTFHARAAVAELGKVYGLPPHEVHRVTKHLPRMASWNLAEAIEQSPEAKGLIETASSSSTAAAMNKAASMNRAATVRERSPCTSAGPSPRDRGSNGASRVNLDEPYATILKLACEFEGLPRHWAMHPCGLVVSPEPLTDLVPLQRSPKNMLVAQYDMDAIEDLGFVKVDLLGQAGLSVLRDAVEEINSGVSHFSPEDAPSSCRGVPSSRGDAPLSQGVAPVSRGVAPISRGDAPVSRGAAQDFSPRRKPWVADRREPVSPEGAKERRETDFLRPSRARRCQSPVTHGLRRGLDSNAPTGLSCPPRNVPTELLGPRTNPPAELPNLSTETHVGFVDLNSAIDYSDAATWEMIARGDARGVHHIESPAMTSLLQQCNCRDIDCLTAVVAVIRPGAANQGKKEAFARRHQGLETPSYAHPSLKAALEKTYGLMVFEEHILQVATEFAGMNLGRADVLRRALNKGNAALIAELKSEFYASALLNGRQPGEINVVWPLLEGFSGFMFNKAHSAEYAVEAFQGAWLKLRWPAQYIAAILSNYRGFYAGSPTLPQILYVMEALRLGIGFRPPCVNGSARRFHVEARNEECRIENVERGSIDLQQSACEKNDSSQISGKGFNSPVGALEPSPRRKPWVGGDRQHPALEGRKESVSRRGLESCAAPRLNHNPVGSSGISLSGKPVKSPEDADSSFYILNSPCSIPPRLAIRIPISHINGLSRAFLDRYLAERADRPFSSLADFMHRCRPGDTEAQSLLDAGAFDCFGECRPAMFWQLRKLLRRADVGRSTLWSDAVTEDNLAPPVDLTEPDIWQIARREMDLLGFPITIDPLTFLGRDDKGRDIDWRGYVPVAELNKHHRRRVAVCGLMVADRISATQAGDLMKFVTLADHTGFVEAVLFPDAYQRFGHLTVANPILATYGVVDPFENGNGFILRVQHVSPPRRSGKTARNTCAPQKRENQTEPRP